MGAVIQIDHLSKQYRLGELDAKRFRDDVSRWIAKLRGREDPLAQVGLDAANRNSNNHGRSGDEWIWALDDISFEIEKGEVLGIIGRNGAGKSTLLKILSQVTEPTRGEVRIKGRIASLLEVGTGFQPDLSGRDNIFLNGAILGMTKAEIRRKFDEIVAFSEVEKFIDTPVKRYSSGMYVRLAFAVAAHLEPEILIVDEVLAVGDAAFQKKCLGKMQDVAGKEGRTVLFVSHSMPAVTRLCQHAVLLDHGKLVEKGPVSRVVHRYMMSDAHGGAERVWKKLEEAPGNDIARLKAVRVLGDDGIVRPSFSVAEPVHIEIDFVPLKANRLRLVPTFHLVQDSGLTLLASADFHVKLETIDAAEGKLCRARCTIPAELLAVGSYGVLAAIVSFNPNIVHALDREAITFRVDEQEGESSVRGDCAMDWPGLVRPHFKWRTTRVLQT